MFGSDPGMTHPRPSPVLSPELRTRLGEVIEEARRVAQTGAANALEALAVGDPDPYDHMSMRERALRNRLRMRGRQAGDESIASRKGAQHTTHLAHEVAYEHWHRMLFTRFLAENDLLIEPEYRLAVSLDDCRDLARDRDQDHWELAGSWARTMLPEIFRAGDPALELSLPPETGQDLEKLLDSLPAHVFTARDSLGWTYQHWRSDEKDSVNRSEVKIGADEIPAVTQLFTERYMVLFLLHNTIGAWWAGKVLAQDPALAARATDEGSLRQEVHLSAGGGYDFTHLRFVRTRAETDEGDERTGPWRPVAGTFPDWPRAACKLRILDPCCGSGHFLVEAFELLARLRMAEDEEMTGADAARAVLRDNLFGLEIDPRCTQIAVFHVALAAWRLAGGWIKLPALNIACSGIGPECSEADWTRVATGLEQLTGMAQDADLFGRDASLATGPLEGEMRALHGLFSRARELGSLIEPERVDGEPGPAGYGELGTLLSAAMAVEDKAENPERVVAAAGMARAAKILRGSYTLVVTNVPFLARGKQAPGLREFAVANHGDAKGDLATVFASRIFGWLGGSGTQALVMPQNWLFLKTYRRFRERLLRDRKWHVVARLGPGAFETISGEVVNVALVILSAGRPGAGWEMMGMDVSSSWGQPPIRAVEKARLLAGEAPVVPSVQKEQLANPDARILMEPFGEHDLLSAVADFGKGSTTGDRPRFLLAYWEVPCPLPADSVLWLDSPGEDTRSLWTGRSFLLKLPADDLDLRSMPGSMLGGRNIFGRIGVAVRKTGTLAPYIYSGEMFDDNVGVLAPRTMSHVAAIMAFCESGEYERLVRQIDQALKVTAATLVKVPFDLEHWTKVAAKRYPRGLPEPYSDDPTQWIFHGDPCRSVIWDKRAKQTAPGPTRCDKTVLQVAVARLVGYHWPAELDPDMRLAPEQRALANRSPTVYDRFADTDGIVCIPPVRGEYRAADRLYELLRHAYGDEWSEFTEHRLLEAATSSGRVPKSLEAWLRNNFFAEHCKLFHNRPFIWHIWDGHPEGFSALVNYHKLAGPGEVARRTLESLTWAYLNDWLDRQQAEQSEGKAGADARIAHAQDLQGQLQRILEGEPPCDLFVRWKPLGAQPLGWRPDLDDGVRLNIRPFMRAQLLKGGQKGAGVLRRRVGAHWKRDRGKEPEGSRSRTDYPWFWGCPGGGNTEARTDFVAQEQASFDGHRWNDLHYTRAAKEAARKKVQVQGDQVSDP